MTTKKGNGLLLAIDANSLLHRAYHAYPLTLVTSDGKPVNAVYGFTAMLLDALLKYRPEFVFCAFDTAKPTFRHTEYVGYKAHRPQTDSDLINQIPFVDKVLEALNIPVLRVEGFEADDILATVAKRASQEVLGQISFSYVLTGDRDLFQLVDERVRIIMPKGSFKNLQEYGRDEVKESFGVFPEQVPDIKGLMGDASDNIPGVSGVGPKTASDLIENYGTMESIYQHMEEIGQKSKRLAEKLLAEEELAVLSKKLATVAYDAPVAFSADAAKTNDFSLTLALRVFGDFQFKSLVPKLRKFCELVENVSDEIGSKNTDSALNSEDILEAFGLTAEQFEKIVDSEECIETAGMPLERRILTLTQEISKDSEMTTLFYYDAIKSEISTVKLPESELVGKLQLISIGLFALLNDSPVGVSESSLSKTAQESLKKLLADETFIDLSALEYFLSAGRNDYAVDISTEDAPLRKAIWLQILKQLKEALEKKKDYKALDRVEQLWPDKRNIPVNFQHEIDLPLQFGVALMHLRGIGINTDLVKKSSVQLQEEISSLEKAIFDDVGHEFNIRSTKQLADVLFNQLGLPALKKTKTGLSTDDEVLQELVDAHPVITRVLRFRQLTKLLGTYITPFLEYENGQRVRGAKTGEQLQFGASQPDPYFRIHSQFSPMYTSTGRLSSNNPNLQNLPIKTDDGKVIRTFFVPEKGKCFISFDYSQIDLRVMAHISGDTGLTEAFKEGRDIHRATASKIFSVDYDKVGDAQRRVAKTVNFGLLYGMSPFGLSRSLGIPVKEADTFIKAYFENFPKVKDYMNETIETAIKTGWVMSLLGRRRYVFGLDVNNAIRRQAAQREAINMPVQGGSDDIMRKALGEICLLPEQLDGKLRLVLQIHDELVFEADNSKEFLDEIIPKIKEIMENVVKLSVPLKVEYGVGENLDI